MKYWRVVQADNSLVISNHAVKWLNSAHDVFLYHSNQEIITMAVFAGFAYWYMGKPLTLNYLWAGLCMIGAAYFIFRDSAPA